MNSLIAMGTHFPPLDVGMGMAIVFLGLLGLLALAAAILLEALVLRRLGWGDIGRSLLDSFLMNAASAAVGVLVAVVFQGAIEAPSGMPAVLGCLPITWGLSVIVEAAALALLRKRGFRSVLRPAVIANTASYALIAVVALLTALFT